MKDFPALVHAALGALFGGLIAAAAAHLVGLATAVAVIGAIPIVLLFAILAAFFKADFWQTIFLVAWIRC